MNHFLVSIETTKVAPFPRQISLYVNTFPRDFHGFEAAVSRVYVRVDPKALCIDMLVSHSLDEQLDELIQYCKHSQSHRDS